jgi:hypothetical protein
MGHSSRKYRTIALVADATDSAAPFWEQTAKTIADLVAALSGSSVLSVYLLGTHLHWAASAWRPNMPIPPEASRSGSFLAPVMAELRMMRVVPDVGIVVGTGEVFDLEDWGNGVARWILVREGDRSLQNADGRLPELAADESDRLVDLLHTTPSDISRPSLPRQEGRVEHQWRLDLTGYPLVYVPPIGTYVHLFPIAKPQFECFLAESRLSEYGDAWYATLLEINPRLSPAAVSFADYERLFVTGLLPSEVQAYISWHGQGFSLLSSGQWLEVSRWMETKDLSVLPADLEHDLAPTALQLWDGLLRELHPRTLLDLSLMRAGVVEWVHESGRPCLGMGHPRQCFRPGYHDITRPYEPTPAMLKCRSKFFGFRLMC